MPTETKTKPRIRVCADCKVAPAKGIRSKRCLECHQAYLKAKTQRFNAERSRKARESWSPICEYDGCIEPKYSTRFATKYCVHHRDIAKDEATQEWRERRKAHKIANPGRCQNPGCTSDAYSYRSKYCTPCRAELRKTSNAMYRRDKQMEHNEKNLQVLEYCRQKLNEIVNEASDSPEALDTPQVHRLATIMLQLRAWNSK
jgi:hypothetical protein